jgi:DNA-binding HxlR family transcriptional regulator
MSTNKFMSMITRKISSTNFANETFLDDRCVLNKVTKIIGKRWVPEILLLIEKDVHRFSALKEQLEGISDNVLGQSLNGLVKMNLLQKKIYNEVPLKVEYNLLPAGQSLMMQLHKLCSWARLHVEK